MIRDNLFLIACIGKNYELGIDNDLIWKFKNDMKFFKNTTINNSVIMGRRTYESMGRLLPNRENIIITSNNNYNIDGGIIFNNNKDVIDYIDYNKNKMFYVIGGASIYKYYLDYCSSLYLTEVNDSAYATVYFPRFNKNDYNSSILYSYNENDINYDIKKYVRKR